MRVGPERVDDEPLTRCSERVALDEAVAEMNVSIARRSNASSGSPIVEFVLGSKNSKF